MYFSVTSGIHLGHFAVAAYEEMRKMQTSHFLQGCDVAECFYKFDVPVCTMIKESLKKKKKNTKSGGGQGTALTCSVSSAVFFFILLLDTFFLFVCFFQCAAYSSTTATPKERCTRIHTPASVQCRNLTHVACFLLTAKSSDVR